MSLTVLTVSVDVSKATSEEEDNYKRMWDMSELRRCVKLKVEVAVLDSVLVPNSPDSLLCGPTI